MGPAGFMTRGQASTLHFNKAELFSVWD